MNEVWMQTCSSETKQDLVNHKLWKTINKDLATFGQSMKGYDLWETLRNEKGRLPPIGGGNVVLSLMVIDRATAGCQSTGDSLKTSHHQEIDDLKRAIKAAMECFEDRTHTGGMSKKRIRELWTSSGFGARWHSAE